MADSPLSDLHSWLTLLEAANRIGNAIGCTVEVSDVLRMALDDALKLSVRLPAGTPASLLVDDGERVISRPARVGGVAALALDETGSRLVQAEMHLYAGLPSISMEDSPGAIVHQGGQLYRLHPEPGSGGLSPHPASALPDEVQLGVTQDDLQNAIATALARLALARQNGPERAASGAGPAPADAGQRATSISPEQETEPAQAKPESLVQKERDSLLLIIAALMADVDLSREQVSKAAVAIEAMTHRLGVAVARRTIEGHLKRINDVIERRARDKA